MPFWPAWKSLIWPLRLIELVSGGSISVAFSRAALPPTGSCAIPTRRSGASFHSTRISSAPSAERKRGPPPEASHHVKSRIRTPDRAKGLPHRDRRLSVSARAEIRSARVPSPRTSANADSVCSPSRGARGPRTQCACFGAQIRALKVSLGVVRCHLGGPEGGTRYCGWAKPPHFFRGAGIAPGGPGRLGHETRQGSFELAPVS